MHPFRLYLFIVFLHFNLFLDCGILASVPSHL